MVRYSIYQLTKGTANYIKKVFMPLDCIEDFSLDNYTKVYEGEIEEAENIYATLERLFMMFNVNHPSDYKCRSLSVSDVVVIDGKNYYCDSLGFKEVN